MWGLRIRHNVASHRTRRYPETMRHTRDSVLERVTDEYNALEAAIAKLGGAEWELLLGKREGEDPWTV